MQASGRLNFAHDGTLRRPTAIWIVRSGDEMYVRSVNDPEGHWYRTAENTHRGQISATVRPRT